MASLDELLDILGKVEEIDAYAEDTERRLWSRIGRLRDQLEAIVARETERMEMLAAVMEEAQSTPTAVNSTQP